MHAAGRASPTRSAPGSARRKAIRAEASKTTSIIDFARRFRTTITDELLGEELVGRSRRREECLNFLNDFIQRTKRDSAYGWFEDDGVTRFQAELVAQLGGNDQSSSLAKPRMNDAAHILTILVLKWLTLSGCH